MLHEFGARSNGERHWMASKSSNDQVMKEMSFDEIIEENERIEKKSKQVVRDWDEREQFEAKIDQPYVGSTMSFL